jgi:hypothetical protein
VHPDDLPKLPCDPHKVYGAVCEAEHMVRPLDPTAQFDKQDYYLNPHRYTGVFHEKVKNRKTHATSTFAHFFLSQLLHKLRTYYTHWAYTTPTTHKALILHTPLHTHCTLHCTPTVRPTTHAYPPTQVAPHTNVLVNGMYWEPRFPRLLSNQQLRDLEQSNRAATRRFIGVGDITCDIEGSVECLNRSSVLESPYYLYNSKTDSWKDGLDGEGLMMMAVDNLPAEFPREASSHFSSNLMPFVQSLAASDSTAPLSDALPEELRLACITSNGR